MYCALKESHVWLHIPWHIPMFCQILSPKNYAKVWWETKRSRSFRSQTTACCRLEMPWKQINGPRHAPVWWIERMAVCMSLRANRRAEKGWRFTGNPEIQHLRNEKTCGILIYPDEWYIYIYYHISWDISWYIKLVGGLEHEFYFSIIYGKFIIPTDDSSYFSEG